MLCSTIFMYCTNSLFTRHYDRLLPVFRLLMKQTVDAVFRECLQIPKSESTDQSTNFVKNCQKIAWDLYSINALARLCLVERVSIDFTEAEGGYTIGLLFIGASRWESGQTNVSQMACQITVTACEAQLLANRDSLEPNCIRAFVQNKGYLFGCFA